MKQLIKDILEDASKGQINLASAAAREVVANLIMGAIESKGWFLNLGTAKCQHGNLIGGGCDQCN